MKRNRLHDLKTVTLPDATSAPVEIIEAAREDVPAIWLAWKVPIRFVFADSPANALTALNSAATVLPYGVLYGCNNGIELPCSKGGLRLYVRADEATANEARGLSYACVLGSD